MGGDIQYCPDERVVEVVSVHRWIMARKTAQDVFVVVLEEVRRNIREAFEGVLLATQDRGTDPAEKTPHDIAEEVCL